MGSDLFNRMRQLAAQLGRNDLPQEDLRTLRNDATKEWEQGMGRYIVTKGGKPVRVTGQRGSKENEQS